MADFGYDVWNYCDVDPLFGTLADLDALVADAHRLGLRVVMDWVPNHTSDAHPWFGESRSSPDNPRRDWYIWRDTPNNWRAAFMGVGGSEFPSAWTYDGPTGQWYLHLFLDRQPDLNWANPDVVRAMSDTLEFWLDRGVDGFRIDVVHALAKPPGLPDLPPDLAPIPMAGVIDEPAVHPLIAGIRSVVKGASPPERVVIGETVLPTVAQIAPYYGTAGTPELDLAFNFHPMRARWNPKSWRKQIDRVADTIVPNGWPTWVLSNHDNPRHRTRYGSEARARAAAILLLGLPGTPFLFAGEELGLADADVPPGRQVDPGGRDGCRAPIPWDRSPLHGWAGHPWLPWPPEADEGRTAAEEADDPGSTLNLYRRLLASRKASPALQTGTFSWLRSSVACLAWRRRAGEDDRLAAVNFTSEASWVDLPAGTWTVDLSTISIDHRTAKGRFELGPDEGVFLKRT